MGLKKKVFLFLCLIFSGFLSACARMDKNRCLNVNWYELGRQDSALGLEQETCFLRRQSACPLDEDSIQAKAYKNGFAAGLREYCRFKTGYIYGLSRLKEETGGCPESLKRNFKQGYEAGRQMNLIQSLQNQIQEQMRRLEEKLQHHDREARALSLAAP